MPEISQPQVVAFANNQVRPMADKLYAAYFAAKSTILDYNNGDIGTKITVAGSSELIDDGSATDGRTRITGGDVFNLITALQEYVKYVENQAVATADRTGVIGKPHVN